MKKTNPILNNQVTSLIESSRKDIHKVQNAMAAYRLLTGALLTGFKSHDGIEDVIKSFLINTNQVSINLIDESDFLKDIKGGAFQKSTKKYNYIKNADFSFNGKKILFVEDNFVTAGWKDVFEQIFNSNDIVHVKDEDGTLNYLKVNREKTSCVFLDLRLPDTEEDGLGLLEEIRNKFPEIPVVIFSVSDSVIYAKLAFELGAWDFFTKEPVDSDNRNPIDYFVSFHGIVKKIVSFNNNYVEKYWNSINKINKELDKYENENGSGLTKIVKRELLKAYKHLVFTEIYNYLPAFLEMEHYDEVIFCSSKAFESMLTFYTIRTGIQTERNRDLVYDDEGKAKAVYEETDIMNELKGLGLLINNIKTNKSMNSDWIDKAQSLINKRNKCIHGFLRAYSWGSGQTKPAEKDTAEKFLASVLELITEMVKMLKMKNFDWRQLDLGPRTTGILRMNMKGNLLDYTIEQLMNEFNFTPKSIRELSDQLAVINLKFKDAD